MSLHSKEKCQIHIQDWLRSIQKTENCNPLHLTNRQDIGKETKKLLEVIGEVTEENCQCYISTPTC